MRLRQQVETAQPNPIISPPIVPPVMESEEEEEPANSRLFTPDKASEARRIRSEKTSERRRKIMELLDQGHSEEYICKELDISRATFFRLKR